MSKSLNPGYVPGENWVICDRCGFAYRASEIKETWDGFLVCEEDWEPRHPQDFVRSVPEDIAPSVVRTEPTVETVDLSYDTDSQETGDITVPSSTNNNGL